jgi:hypothetical protein
MRTLAWLTNLPFPNAGHSLNVVRVCVSSMSYLQARQHATGIKELTLLHSIDNLQFHTAACLSLSLIPPPRHPTHLTTHPRQPAYLPTTSPTRHATQAKPGQRRSQPYLTTLDPDPMPSAQCPARTYSAHARTHVQVPSFACAGGRSFTRAGGLALERG